MARFDRNHWHHHSEIPNWLNARKANLKLRVHLLEGKQFKMQLLNYPELVNDYFLDECLDLIKSGYKNWIFHGLFLAPAALHKLFCGLDVRRLSKEELTFLICNIMIREEEIGSFCEDEGLEIFNYRFLLQFVPPSESSEIMDSDELKDISIRDGKFFGSQYCTIEGTDIASFYCRYALGDNLLELYLKKDNKVVDARLQYRNTHPL